MPFIMSFITRFITCERCKSCIYDTLQNPSGFLGPGIWIADLQGSECNSCEHANLCCTVATGTFAFWIWINDLASLGSGGSIWTPDSGFGFWILRVWAQGVDPDSGFWIWIPDSASLASGGSVRTPDSGFGFRILRSFLERWPEMAHA